MTNSPINSSFNDACTSSPKHAQALRNAVNRGCRFTTGFFTTSSSAAAEPFCAFVGFGVEDGFGWGLDT